MKILAIDHCFTKGDENLFSGEAELGTVKITPLAIDELEKHFDSVQAIPDNGMIILTNQPVEKIIIFNTGRAMIRRVISKGLAVNRFELIEKILA
jgi:hypothetical protein